MTVILLELVATLSAVIIVTVVATITQDQIINLKTSTFLNLEEEKRY